MLFLASNQNLISINTLDLTLLPCAHIRVLFHSNYHAYFSSKKEWFKSVFKSNKKVS
jgi:hypothetical protein